MKVFTRCSLILVLFTGGCAPGHFWLKEADLHLLDRRLAEQGRQVEELGREQTVGRELTQTAHAEVLEQLQQLALQQKEQLRRQQAWERYIRRQRQALAGDDEKGAGATISVVMADDKQVVGAVEKVWLAPPGTLLPARIDTGAATSSLDAREIQSFERNGERWVRFTIVDPEDGKEILIECKVVRQVRILQAVAEEAERRPVVELGVTVGGMTQAAQFTLSDRRHLEYPVLIGRNILMDLLVVDVSRTHIAPPVLP